LSAKILIVEDNPDSCALLLLLLSIQGSLVTMATDGQQAIERVKADCPDLILSDINMPNLNGVEMVKIIRMLPQCNLVPIVMMSAYGSGPVGEAMKAGATEALRKPVDFDVLLQTVQRLLV
jgi:CheY-like chemotaxis protein